MERIDDEGRRLQSLAIPEHQELVATLRALFRTQPADALRDFDDEIDG